MTGPAEIIYMDAVLTPNRSLSPKGFAVVMTVVGVISFIAGMAFLSMGALPVVGFFGLDALAIWLAFRWSFRQQEEQTRVIVTTDTLKLHHRSAKGAIKEATLPSAFARVELDEPLTPQSWLRIEHGQKAYIIGRFLTLPERKSFARALRSALQAARSERHPS